jgi:transmembrane sensor
LDTEEIKILLEKYRLGNCTDTEAQLIEEWLATIKYDDISQFGDTFIKDQLVTAKNQIDQVIGAAPVPAKHRSYSWLAAAASLLILCSSIAIWATYFRKTAANDSVKYAGFEQHTAKGWVYVKTEKGITHKIKLSDGSTITLDASSNLRYPARFVNHKRPIYLDEGEALFEVAKDKTSPFTVYTPKFATTALGTAFNIRSYAKENKVSISLLHGKIKIEDLHPFRRSEASRILLPHQQVVLNKQSGTMMKSSFDDETPITSWKDGVLSFRDATMDEVINSIENRFNVVIKNNSNHINWSYTGTFKSLPLNDVLKTVCLTEGIASYTIVNNNVTLN